MLRRGGLCMQRAGVGEGALRWLAYVEAGDGFDLLWTHCRLEFWKRTEHVFAVGCVRAGMAQCETSKALAAEVGERLLSSRPVRCFL